MSLSERWCFGGLGETSFFSGIARQVDICYTVRDFGTVRGVMQRTRSDYDGYGYELPQEIMRGNTAAGIYIFGVYIGLALVIGGAVH